MPYVSLDRNLGGGYIPYEFVVPTNSLNQAAGPVLLSANPSMSFVGQEEPLPFDEKLVKEPSAGGFVSKDTLFWILAAAFGGHVLLSEYIESDMEKELKKLKKK